MSRLQCRSSIARTAVALALLSPGAADAEIVVVVPSPRQPKHIPGPWITGAKYDMVNKSLAEHHLQRLQAKLGRDAERGDSAAVVHDHHRIAELGYRIAADEWLIRKLSWQELGYYPRRIDETSLAAMVEAARPSEDPAAVRYGSTPGPMTVAPTISITIVNAGPAGAGVAFAIDGVSHQAGGDSRQDLAVAPGSYITYDGGGSLGRRRYRVSPGVYEFRSTPEGWALYKLPDMP